MTTDLARLEKRISVIEKLKRVNGFLLYFFTHFKKMSIQTVCQINQWKSITKYQDQYRWTCLENEAIGFLLDPIDSLYFNISENRFQSLSDNYPTENRDMCQLIMDDGFDYFFIQHYCVSIEVDTLPMFITITKEDSKSSWILDKSKHIIYFKFRNLK